MNLRLVFAAASVTANLAGQPIPMPPPNYCFGLLTRPASAPALPVADLQRIQAAHLQHLGSLAESGWLVGAGPLAKAETVRGVLISKCASIQEAVEKASADPAVKAGRLAVVQYRWTGPEGIGERYRQHKKANPDAKDDMRIYPLIFIRRTSAWKDGPPAAMFQQHIAYATLLPAKGLVAGGPLHESADRVGVYVFDGVPFDTAKMLVAADPLVKSGLVEMESYEWYAADGTFASSVLSGK